MFVLTSICQIGISKFQFLPRIPALNYFQPWPIGQDGSEDEQAVQVCQTRCGKSAKVRIAFEYCLGFVLKSYFVQEKKIKK